MPLQPPGGAVEAAGAPVVLVDSSVWIAHLRVADSALAKLLAAGLVRTHSWVIGELACGTLRNRREALRWMDGIPMTPVATDAELRVLVEGSDRQVGHDCSRGSGATQAPRFSAIAEQNHCGDAPNVESRGDIGELLGIHLRNEDLPRTLIGNLLHFWAHCAAGPAPSGPEIHKDRHRSITDELIEFSHAPDRDGTG
jgi:hypothetical protein